MRWNEQVTTSLLNSPHTTMTPKKQHDQKFQGPHQRILSQPLASELSTATDPDLSFRRSANRVKFESLKTLNPGLWLLSDVINGFAMNILRPRVSNRRVHFFSTYFFSRLLDTGTHGTHKPINHRNVHWLCLKVVWKTNLSCSGTRPG
jgi:Ulp1 family protease